MSEFNPNVISEVVDKRQRLWKEQEHMLQVALKEKRTFTEDEKAKYDAIEKDWMELDEHKRRLESAKQKEAELAEVREEAASELKITPEEYRLKSRKAFEKYLKYGLGALNNDEKNEMYAAHDKTIGSSVMARGTNTQIAGTTTLGGFTVPQDWSGQIDMALQAIGSVDQVAMVYQSNRHGALPWPKVDDTAVSGAIMTEGSAPNVSDLTFGSTTLNDYTYTSGWVKLSLQLLEDEDVDLVSLVGKAVAERLQRGMNAHWTTGTGSSQPNGIVTTASEGVDGGDTGALSASILYDLKDSVDPAYAVNGKWMFNNSTLTLIKKLSVGSSDNRPLWVPSLSEGAPATIDGDPYIINQQMPSAAAAAKYVLYGDFKGYLVRKIGGVKIIRTNERYIDALSVGFLGYARTDGDKISGGNPYKYLYRTAT